jgi:uncharacterized sulfatase
MQRWLHLGIVTLWLVGTAQAEKPNVILIISDDHGYTDYGFMGHGVARTPNLDRLASQGMLYTRGYATPLCSPSLASLLTGRLPHQHGITGNDLAHKPGEKVLGPQVRSPLVQKLLANPLLLPKTLRDAGYLTLQTGKLWNTTYQEVGFTHGMTKQASRHGDDGLEIGRKGFQPIWNFLAEAQAQKKPFFIWYAPMMPHTPHTPPKRLLDQYTGRGLTPAAEKYFAMVEWFDETCGELDQYLSREKLQSNTIIVYLADNGWDAVRGANTQRSKLSPYELGIRTPIFVRWPGKVPALRDDETLASIIDVVPTILDLAEVPRPAELPGRNLTNRKAMQARPAVTVEAYTHDIANLNDPMQSSIAQVVLEGWYKLIVPGKARPDKPHSSAPMQPELFDLRNDPNEEQNLAQQQPERVKRLRALGQQAWPAPGMALPVP